MKQSNESTCPWDEIIFEHEPQWMLKTYIRLRRQTTVEVLSSRSSKPLDEASAYREGDEPRCLKQN